MIDVDEAMSEAGDESAPTRTAREKVEATLRELSKPDEDAGAMQLTLASVAMALENGLGEELERAEETGEINAFILGLTRWIASHRGEDSKQLLVVEVPRARELPAGTRLHLLDEALEAARQVVSPL